MGTSEHEKERIDSALHGKQRAVRLAAVKELEDQETLAHIAEHDNDALVRESAVRRIDGNRHDAKEVLWRIARGELSPRVGRAAVEELTSPMALIDVALHGRSSAARKAAVEKLDYDERGLYFDRDDTGLKFTSKTALLHVAQHDSDSEVRAAARGRIDKGEGREAAAEKLGCGGLNSS